MNIDTVVKVGGSLYDLPDLGSRLGSWLAGLKSSNVVLIPGGGRAADLVRAWDREQGLGEETSHWLALRALTFNAHYLASILPGAHVVQSLEETDPDSVSILDMHAWAQSVDSWPGRFPHTWEVTSDSLAVQAAILSEAAQLILLKSVGLEGNIDWHEAVRRGIVDSYFPRAIKQASGLNVRVVCFR
jgi:aspartokinase-like uncharacterized kinase